MVDSLKRLKDTWEGYDPSDDAELKDFRLRSKMSFIQLASQNEDVKEKIDEEKKRNDKQDRVLDGISGKIKTASAGVKGGWSVLRYIGIFVVKTAAIGGTVYAVVRLAL